MTVSHSPAPHATAAKIKKTLFFGKLEVSITADLKEASLVQSVYTCFEFGARKIFQQQRLAGMILKHYFDPQ